MQYITVQEAGASLAVKDETVRRWVRKGLLKGSKIGRILRVEAESVQRLLAQTAVSGVCEVGAGRPGGRPKLSPRAYRHLTPRNS